MLIFSYMHVQVNIVVMVMVMYVILRARKKKNDDTFLFWYKKLNNFNDHTVYHTTHACHLKFNGNSNAL